MKRRNNWDKYFYYAFENKGTANAIAGIVIYF
jgi:hypothetical protein